MLGMLEECRRRKASIKNSRRTGRRTSKGLAIDPAKERRIRAFGQEMNVAGLDIARCALQPAAKVFEAGGQLTRGGASSGQYPT